MRGHVAILSSFLIVGCGGVSAGDPDAAEADIDAPMGAIDAAPDADTCPDFVAPPGAQELGSLLCSEAAGFNPDATPTFMVIGCPTGAPNLHGAVNTPASDVQADGCDATTPVFRYTAPQVDGGLIQSSTPDLTIGAGDRLRLRASCPDGVANCNVGLQITGSQPGMNQLIFPPAGGTELITGTTIVDVDVEFPAGLVGPNVSINVIGFAGAQGTAEMLVQNPHIVSP